MTTAPAPLPLLLLAGMMCDARLFTPQIAAFSARRTVHVPWLGGAETMAALADQVLAQAPPRFALAGLSMGGILAMEMLARAPDRIDRLALLDTNPLAEHPTVQAGRAAQMARARAGDLEAMMQDTFVPNYLASGAGTGPLADLCRSMARDLGAQVFCRQSLALRDRADRQDTLRGLTCPALVLCGQQDRVCPVARHELMRDLIPGARLEVIAGAGHLPVLERPETTNAALRRWLEEAP
ncbi:alpha/beta fold hydrolase [Pseudooceanicola sediminis]|uniref:Alpha/beta fold hydrolase n=1 Tax=Pseudooceanicola sediminis TaxID=2211117 RepID=A0A399IWK6_9RHOB|nr:alpha/beta fold hydrolase [Pseudooceanicola sediminis]KAA2314988.1 alpha/beta fold hydrolase [Puniceibacterium sp. HSS470]RII37360.1 alpha/beta fold hydrolase [Pseudooceanicola sediminis]|tara:strand:- start:43054 stop:43770 length:717 start_codon:yes stop_codon:yes gene_type:complete